MRFTIKQAGCNSERVGCLTGFLKSPNTVIETPTSALLTQVGTKTFVESYLQEAGLKDGGSVVHLTAEVLARVFPNPQLLWVPLSNTFHLETGLKTQGQGIGKFAALPEHVTCATLQSMSEDNPAGHFEADKVPLWTKNGKKMITAERYMELMELLKPDIILAIADGHTSPNEGVKRVAKSVDRTCNMLDISINRYKASDKLRDSAFIGVVVGSLQDKKCNVCIQHVLKYKDQLSGIALAGITDGSSDSFNVPVESIENIFKKVDEAVPKDLLRIIEGSWNPAVVVAAIDHGWDMFDGSYPLKLTNVGQALVLNFDVTRNSDELCVFDLNDKRYKEDFRPILAGCECLACKKHTRAYIQHLLNTREMLSNVLLSIHNLHHYDQLFLHARRHIEAKTYSVFREHITKQYLLYKNSHSSNGDSKSDKEVKVNGDEMHDIIQQKKKTRIVSNVNHVPNGNVASGNVA